MSVLKGSCLCQRIQFELPDEFEYMGNCHCSECRKFTGSDYSSVGGISSSKFRLVQGEEALAVYAKSEDTELGFCRECGSSLFSRKLKTGKHNIRLGVLDSVPSHQPGFHIFVDSKAAWSAINDTLPQFAEGPGSMVRNSQ